MKVVKILKKYFYKNIKLNIDIILTVKTEKTNIVFDKILILNTS